MPLFGKSKPVETTHHTTTVAEPRHSSGGLFGSKSHTTTQPVVTEPRRSSGLFGSKSHTTSQQVVAEPRRSTGGGGMFSSRRRGSSSSRSVSPRRSTGGGGLLHRGSGDPSIRSAHDRVRNAEVAEREADKALLHARNVAKDAREQVKRLEREAAEEARMAKIKQKESRAISKRAGKLGGL